MLDTKRLRVLCEVAKYGSFSAAATSLGYTQPAVSRQISTLEAELGTVLVRRVPQGTVLTDGGRILVDRAKEILARIEDAEAELLSLAGLEGGRLRVASFASAAASILPLAIARFRQRYPAVELSVAMADPVDSIPSLRAGELDMVLSHDAALETVGEPPPAVAICDGSPARRAGDIDLVHLFDDPMYVAMPLGHPLAGQRVLGLARFAEEPWMLATTKSCPDSRRFLRACHAAGFEPRIAFQNDDYPAMLGFVAAGVGVALVPEMVTRAIREDVIVRELDPAPPPRPILVALSSGYRSPAALAMLDLLREVGDEWVADRHELAAAA